MTRASTTGAHERPACDERGKREFRLTIFPTELIFTTHKVFFALCTQRRRGRVLSSQL